VFLEEFWGPKRKAGRLMKEPAEGSEVKTKSKRGKKKNGRKRGPQGDDDDGDDGDNGDNGDDNGDGGDGDDYGDYEDGGGVSSSSSSHVPSLHLVGGTGIEMELDSNLETAIESTDDRMYSDGGDGVADSAEEQGDASTPNRKKSRNIIMSEW
jgi:hypothetical protein